MAEKKSKTTGNAKPKGLYLKIPYHILNIRDLGLAEKVLLAHSYSFGNIGSINANCSSVNSCRFIMPTSLS